ncbi:MAG: discoidin domain-containing protein [Vicinamibacterales bacterium]
MNPRARNRRALAVAAVTYLLLATAVTWPLARALNTHVPHDPGDPVLSTTLLWWNAHALPLTERWWDGLWFFPAGGSMAFSDPRLGASLLASPFQWLGASAATAYNLTLLLSFPLTALSAFVLVRGLTGRNDAAALAGLAFGFNPYRIAHIEHLELLLTYAMPLALHALHRYRATGRRWWLAAVAGAVTLLGLSASYYLLFFSVLLGLWVLWFVPWRDWRKTTAILGAALIGVLVLAPIYVGMWRIHRSYGYDRSDEAASFSADATSIVTASPLLALWGWTSPLNGPERQTFTGAMVLVLTVAGTIVAVTRRRLEPDRVSRVARLLGVVAAAVLVVGLLASVWGPLDVRMGPIRLRMTALFKTVSIAGLLATLGLLASARLRDAHRRRSLMAFYVVAAAVLWLCSLGPAPKMLGRQFLYQPPYAWLMHLPGFAESVRAPARFAMLGALALTVAAALAYTHLSSARATRRRWLFVLCGTGLLLDTWPATFPLVSLPPYWSADTTAVAAVLELPLGPLEYDAAAMYRSTGHHRPVVNGMSGSIPPHYRALSRALADGETSALEAVATAAGPMLVAVNSAATTGDDWIIRMRAMPAARDGGADGPWRFFRMDRASAELRVESERRCEAPVIAIAAARADEGPVPLQPITDRRPDTRWLSRFEMPYSTTLVFELGGVARVCSIELSLGSLAYEYPGNLTVETSIDGERWTEVYRGSVAASAVRAALRDQLNASVTVTFAPTPARLLRLQRTANETAPVWVVADVVVRGH